jgi:hypothetical protein
MDAAPHLGTAVDLEMRTARVADPALGGYCAYVTSHWPTPTNIISQI